MVILVSLSCRCRPMARSHGGYSGVKSNLEPRSGPRIFVGKLNKETTENDVKVQGVLSTSMLEHLETACNNPLSRL